MERGDVSQLVLEAYDCRWRGDIDGVLACFHPDIAMRIHGDPGIIPFAGSHRGRDGVLHFVQRVVEHCEWLGFTLDDLIIDGTQVVVRWHAPIRVHATGRQATLQCVDLITIRDGFIAEFDEYFDTALAATLLGIADLDPRALAAPPVLGAEIQLA